MKRGLVVGKFCPPHNGHHYLIETALKESDAVDILVCDNPKYPIDAPTRAKWLQTIHPEAYVQIIPDIDDDDNSEAWARHTIEFLGYAPDIVFTSEYYGDPYAKYMGCTHRLVDPQRVTVPIAAHLIRDDIRKHWHHMQPEVRQALCLRICVLGAESTGTTTLSRALAEHYKAPWVPELGRYYTESILHTPHEWDAPDFIHIAKLQRKYEDAMAGLSDGMIICDTNAFATKIWQERYIGSVTSDMEALAASSPADLYIVTGDEIPFVQDGIRDGEHLRHSMHQQFVTELAENGAAHTVLRGSPEERLSKAVALVDKLLAKRRKCDGNV